MEKKELTKWEWFIEVVGQAVHEHLSTGKPEDKKALEEISSIFGTIQNAEILVQWPESQDFMEEEWFDEEATLALGNEDEVGSSAYYIPLKRII